jgi:hypothetical protein
MLALGLCVLLLASVPSLARAEPSAASDAAPGFKRVVYHGGLVSFRIPESWVEKYDEARGGTYHASPRRLGTLRLNVLSFEKDGDLGRQPAVELLRRSHLDPSRVRSLPGGNAILDYDAHASEDGEALRMHHWQLASHVPPNHFRLAVFTYTVPEARWGQAAVKREFALVGREVADAKFEQVLGLPGTP